MAETVILRDGAAILIRPIESADRPLLETAFSELSTESRHRRFLSPMRRLSTAQLEYLTNVDHRNHEALVALDEPADRMIGVARFVRTGPSVAEPAVAVADDWQSRGVGTALLEALARRALAEGIEVFSGPVLSDNPAPLRVLDQVGDVSVQHVGGVGQVDVLLRPADPTGGRVRRLRALLRAIAASTIEPGLGAWQRLLPRPSVGLDEPHSNVIVAIVEPSAGAASASAAATVAGELARAWAASVVMVGTAAARDADADAERLLRVAARLEASGTPATYVIARGDVGAAALRVAADRRARLIVVEDRADGAGKPLSATWDFLTHHAPCSVLVTRGPVG